jgi:hypothetical protein
MGEFSLTFALNAPLQKLVKNAIIIQTKLTFELFDFAIFAQVTCITAVQHCSTYIHTYIFINKKLTFELFDFAIFAQLLF